MLATEILTALEEAGATVRINGDKLLVEPRSKVPDNLVPEIKQHKYEIMALLPDPLPAAFDRPPETREETVELIQYLGDPLMFARWFENLMNRSDPAEAN